jgi:hypothetical protein
MRPLSLTVSAVAALSLAAVATATPVTVTYNGVSPSKTVSLSKNSGGTFSNYSAGLVNLTGAVSNQADLRGAFTAFCIDINQSISNGNTYSDFNTAALQNAPIPTSPMGAAKADQIAQLWYNERSILSSADSYAAFQVAIWEIVNDTGLSLSGGSFRAASSTVRTLAQGYLNKVDGTGGRSSLYAIASPTAQDFVVPGPIPAPGAAALGLMGLGMAARRNRRK